MRRSGWNELGLGAVGISVVVADGDIVVLFLGRLASGELGRDGGACCLMVDAGGGGGVDALFMLRLVVYRLHVFLDA